MDARDGWRTYKVGELGRVVTGRTPPTNGNHFRTSGLSFLTPTDLSDTDRRPRETKRIDAHWVASNSQLMIPAGNPAFTCIASIGKCALLVEPAITNQQINSIIVDSSICDGTYLYYALLNEREYIRSIASGAATPIVNKSTFSSVEIRLPPLPIQRRIAGILSAYDDLIEVNARRIKALEEMARRTYDEWFVHYRHPGGDGTKPDGWEVVPCTDAFDISYGKTLPKSKLTEGGDYPVYGAGGIIGRYSQRNIDCPTTLVTSRGAGSGVVWRALDPGFVTNNSFTVLPNYRTAAWHLLMIEFTMKNAAIGNAVGGAAQPQLTIDGLRSVRVTVPDEKLCERFSNFVAPGFSLLSNLTKQNTNLRIQRDALLPRLVSGAIDVSDAESSLPKPAEVAAE